MKDVIPRYKAMRGFDVPRQRRLGHARPAGRGRGREGAAHPRQGRDRGVRRRAVRAALHRSACSATPSEWERLTEQHRLLARPGATPTSPTTSSYVESVWWALVRALRARPALPRPQGRVVVGAGRHRALGAPRSAQGYRTVDDPSIYVRVPARRPSRDASLLVVDDHARGRLPSNTVRRGEPGARRTPSCATATQRLIVARGRCARARREGSGRELPVERTLRGAELVGRRYCAAVRLVPRARSASDGALARRSPPTSSTLDAGTGIVHVAPAFGEDDFELLAASTQATPALPLLCAVRPDGTFDPGDRRARQPGAGSRRPTAIIARRCASAASLVHAEQIPPRVSVLRGAPTTIR